jgi:hypothetical protein
MLEIAITAIAVVSLIALVQWWRGPDIPTS